MPKSVTDLNEAIARRSRRETAARETTGEPPRLAKRLEELAPLARGPEAPGEADQSPKDNPGTGLSRLDDERLKRHEASTPPPLPSPATALIPSGRRGETTISRHNGGRPPSPSVQIAQAQRAQAKGRVIGFIVGLSIAAIVGIVLYALLT